MKIKIGKSIYTLIECQAIETSGARDNALCMGQCNYLKKTIAIVVDTNVANKEYIKKVITHEITHAYMHEYCVSNHWISDIEKSYEEEKVCDFIAWYGEDIIRDAEKIYKYIFEKKYKK